MESVLMFGQCTFATETDNHIRMIFVSEYIYFFLPSITRMLLTYIWLHPFVGFPVAGQIG